MATLRILTLPLLICLLFAATAQASGGGGGSYSSGSFPKAKARQTDHTYEHGKAIFHGRAANHKGVNFCVLSTKSKSGFAKVKRKTVKHLKKTSYLRVAENLVTCDDSKQPIQQLLTRGEVNAVVYYLNKRYKLKLKS